MFVSFPSEIGTEYIVDFNCTQESGAYVVARKDNNVSIVTHAVEKAGAGSFTFEAETSESRIFLRGQRGESKFDALSVYKGVIDCSGNNNHAKINGSLTFAKPEGSDIAVARGFNVVGSDIEFPNSKGWFPYDSDWSFSFITNTNGDFVMSQRGPDAAWNTTLVAGAQVHVSGPTGTKTLKYGVYKETEAVVLMQVSWPENNNDKPVTITKEGNTINMYLCGELSHSSSSGLWEEDFGVSYDNFRISNGYDSANFSQVDYSDRVPSADQIRDLHRDMLNKLSKPSMLTDDVKALAHDKARNQDWIATADHKLHRLDGTCFVETLNVDPAVGDITSLTIDDGEIIVGGLLDISVNLKAKNLRERKIIPEPKTQHKFLGEGDSSAVDFYLPRGWKPMRIEVDGIVKQKGANKTWIEQFDGYRYFIRFKVAPGLFPISCLMQEAK
jgi:hypothetical protein